MRLFFMAIRQPFKGRVTAKEYGKFLLFYSIVMAGCIGIDVLLGRLLSAVDNNDLFCSGIWYLISFFPRLSMASKRLHDVGESGLFAICFVLVPFISFLGSLRLLLRESDMTNQYGPSPCFLKHMSEKEAENESATHGSKENEVAKENITAPKARHGESTVGKAVKKRFCKYCGGEIDPISRKCSGCGKQYFKMPKIKPPRIEAKVAVLLVIAVILVVANGVLLRKYTKLNQNHANIVVDLAEARAATYSLNQQLSELRDKYSAQSKELLGWRADADRYKAAWDADSEKADFLDEHVVIVSDDGTNLYHKYECSRLSLSYFWAYNVEAAISRGYSACPYCH